VSKSDIIKALAIFIFYTSVEILTSIFQKLYAIGKRVSLYILILFLFTYVLQYTFNPVLKIYLSIDKDSNSLSKSSLVEFDKFLMDIESTYKNFFLVRKISIILPFVKNLNIAGGINFYKLTENERLEWNETVLDYYKKYITKKTIRLKEHDGWLYPVLEKIAYKKKNFLKIYKSYIKFKNPNDYYFYNMSQQDPKNIQAIYLTGTSSADRNIKKHIRYLKKIKGNGAVFDVKDVTGFVNYPTQLKEVKKIQKGIGKPISSLKYLADLFKKNNIYSIARLAMFQDERLSTKVHKYSIYKKDKTPLLTKGRRVWVDPTLKEVQDYNLQIIWEVLKENIDEIQLDYIRFPAEGNWRQAQYKNLKHYSEKPQVLLNFLKTVQSLTSSYGRKLSIDVFGIVAWQEKADIKSTGQNLAILQKGVDIISPMLYPSHFGTFFYGFHNPADYPFHFINKGCLRLKKFVDKKVIIRPWLQAFGWRVTNYNASYIEKQISGANKAGYKGWLLWNARNKYLNFKIP